MKLDRAYGVYIHFRDLDKWRKKREIADHYSDVHIEIDGKVLEMTFEEFRDRVFARPEEQRIDIPKLNDRVIEYGNLMFDCGAWDGDDQDEYRALVGRVSTAKRAIFDSLPSRGPQRDEG